MEILQDSHNLKIQKPLCKEIIHSVLNNSLEEAKATKITVATDLPGYSIKESMEDCSYQSPTAKVKINYSMNTVNTSNSSIKVEPETENFEIKNVLLDAPEYFDAREDIKQEPELLIPLKKVDMIEETGKSIDDNLQQITDIDVNQYKITCFNQMEPKSEKGTNEYGKMDDENYEDFKIKNEALDIKEENLESHETSILPGEEEQKDCTFNKYQQYQHGNKQKRQKPEVNMYKCDQCDYHSIEKGNLNRHLLRHKNLEEVNMYKCDQCDYQTIYKSSVKKHLFRHNNHEEVTMHKCDQCDYQTIRRYDLKTHLLRHKNREEVNRFKCDQCNYKAIRRYDLKMHLLRHNNPEEVNRFKCDQCDYQTIRRYDLKTHFLRHNNPDEVNRFRCDQCDYQTDRKGHMKTHLMRHNNPEVLNTFKCDQCRYQTIEKSNLKRHLLRHKNPEEVNMFKCDQCSYQTIGRSNLKRHLLRHKNPEEVNRFKCDQCRYQTILKSNLKRHLLRHKNPEELNI